MPAPQYCIARAGAQKLCSTSNSRLARELILTVRSWVNQTQTDEDMALAMIS